MHHTLNRIKFLILFFIFLIASQYSKAQIAGADSLWCLQIFNHPKYVNSTSYPGNWYTNDSIQSLAGFYAQLDSVFKYKLEDFDKMDSMQVGETLVFDTLRNNTYNLYPFVFQQNNPLVNIDFTLNGKSSKAYSFLFPHDSATQSESAYLVFTGGGNNETSYLVQGIGYHNILCYVTNNLKSSGDVYAYMKPNEDARAIYWNEGKLNNAYMVSYLDSVKRQFGLNYLVEMIATIKYLKTKYCKVTVLGLSEGGYAGLLASLITPVDGVVVSGGYSTGFDTTWSSFSILKERFDSLVFRYQRDTIKNIIAANNTKYLFTWGDGDVVNLMQGEHDSSYTQIFFNDTVHCSYYYNFSYHTFPDCQAINQFTNRVLDIPVVNFYVSDTTNPDSLYTIVSNCGTGSYNFDLFRNDTLYQSYTNVMGDTLIILVDSGLYYLQNIVNINNDSAICNDTIRILSPAVSFYVSDTTNPDSLKTIVIKHNMEDYSFDLFRNDTFYQSYNNITADTTTIVLADSGLYYLRNIVSINGDSVLCIDTVLFNKISVPPAPDGINSYTDDLKIQYNNPVNEQLQIKLAANKNHLYRYKLYDLFGAEKMKMQSNENRVNINMHSLPAGIYFIKISDGIRSYTGKIIKL